MKFFATEFREGMPISVRGFARGLMAMARALGEMDGIGCHIEWSGLGIPKIVVDQPTDEDEDESSQSTPDSESTGLNQKSIQDREIDEETGEEVRQLFGFDSDSVTGVGLSEIIKADTVTGKVSPESAAQKYQIVTRIKTGSGYMIGYMPFGEGDGDEDEMPDDEGAECDQNDHPGGGGGDGSAPEDADPHADGGDESHPGEDGNGTDGDTGDGQHPAADDCYTTAY